MLEGIPSSPGGPLRIMEVCGTHTMVLFRSGLRELLAGKVTFLSGPGCPVCVTPTSMIDLAIEFVRKKAGILATFGDLVRVPGSSSSLEKEMACGGEVKVVYSALDALDVARQARGRQVVFFCVGFETTSPGIACAVDDASREGLKNFSIIPANKLIPPAMQALLESGVMNVDGFLLPGHVSVIIGAGPYAFISRDHVIPCVITGFEPLDMIQAVSMIFRQIQEKRAEVEIQYRRLVQREGNRRAVERLYQVFEPVDSEWRGLGEIPLSGLGLRKPYRSFDALERFHLTLKSSSDDDRCLCGQILRGVATPHQCPLFGRACTPENPVGACMVSSEGTCAAYFRFAPSR
jgi:hydrogenase expression/formation protein HypD